VEFASGDSLFTVDDGLTVLAWNAGAERLTGIPEGDAVGRPCWQLLAGLGEDGDVICHARCSNARLAREGFPLRSRPMLVRTFSGQTRVDVSTLTLADGRLLHVLRPPRSLGRSAIDLSRRERQVLALLARGHRAKSIEKIPSGGHRFMWLYNMIGTPIKGTTETYKFEDRKFIFDKATGDVDGTFKWTFAGENGTTEVTFDVEYEEEGFLPEQDLKFFERRNEVEAEAILTNLKARLEV
jgi:hypothetical protein